MSFTVPKLRKIWLLSICLSMAAFSAHGQTGPSQQPGDGSDIGLVFRSDTQLVVLHTTVLDKDNRLITDLLEKDFHVFENDVRQPLKLFRREDVPVSLGILVDNSGSMRDKRRQVIAAAVDFVKASNRQDEVFVVNFNDEAFLDSGGLAAVRPKIPSQARPTKVRGGPVVPLRKGDGPEVGR